MSMGGFKQAEWSPCTCLVPRQRCDDVEDDLVALLGHDGVAVHDDHVRALQDHPPFLCNSEVEMSRSIFICDTMEFLKLSICTVHTHRQIYRQTDILPQNLDIVPINLSQSKHTKCSYVNNEVMYRVTLVIALHGLG